MNKTKQLWIAWRYADNRPGASIGMEIKLFLDELSNCPAPQRSAILWGIAAVWGVTEVEP